jgi:hypothetical protein
MSSRKSFRVSKEWRAAGAATRNGSAVTRRKCAERVRDIARERLAERRRNLGCLFVAAEDEQRERRGVAADRRLRLGGARSERLLRGT